MFILTDFNIANDIVQVLDTSDMTNDFVRLSSLVNDILSNNLNVVGIYKTNENKNGVVIDSLGISIDTDKAKEELVKFYGNTDYVLPDADANVYVKYLEEFKTKQG